MHSHFPTVIVEWDQSFTLSTPRGHWGGAHNVSAPSPGLDSIPESWATPVIPPCSRPQWSMARAEHWGRVTGAWLVRPSHLHSGLKVWTITTTLSPGSWTRSSNTPTTIFSATTQTRVSPTWRPWAWHSGCSLRQVPAWALEQERVGCARCLCCWRGNAHTAYHVHCCRA